MIVLAPRFIIKFVTTVYIPLDKDIVREMWVKGNLKDQLGINHRKGRKGRKQSSTENLEAAPMFRDQHKRSLSELSNAGDPYEPAVSHSASRSPAPNYMDNSPMSQANDLPMQEAHLLPSPHDRQGLAASPNRIPSYYSASDLPAPSPMPDPVYKYPTGEITTTPPSPRASVVGKASPRRGHAPMPSTSSQLPPYDTQVLPDARGYSPLGRVGGSNNREVFEMHVRGPSDDQGTPHHHTPEGSSSPVPYATAGDGHYDDLSRRPASPYVQDIRRSPYPRQGMSSDGGHTTIVGSYDHTTVVGSYNQHSTSDAWEGPRAL